MHMRNNHKNFLFRILIVLLFIFVTIISVETKEKKRDTSGNKLNGKSKKRNDESGKSEEKDDRLKNESGTKDSKDDTDDINKIFDEEKEKKPKKKTPDAADRSRKKRGIVTFVDRNKRSYILDMMASADMVGEWDNESIHTTKNQFTLRELELGFFAAIDHLGEGTVSLAAHYEEGKLFTEVHEVYFLFPRTFIPNTSVKLGKFFIDAGRLNTIHRHDWSFTTTPIVHEELLDEEAVENTGAEFRILMPWPFWQELSLGVFNGKTFGHSHSEGGIKQNPLITAHLKQFVHLGNNWGTQLGFTYLRWHPTENKRRVSHQSGIDFMLKWKRGKLRSFKCVSEVWYRETRQTRKDIFEDPAPPVENRLGAYTFIEYQFHEEWSVGIRFDGFTDPNKRGELGYTYANGTASESIMLTFKPSEFSYFRITGERSTVIETGERSYQGYFQADFILGKHPAHTY